MRKNKRETLEQETVLMIGTVVVEFGISELKHSVLSVKKMHVISKQIIKKIKINLIN